MSSPQLHSAFVNSLAMKIHNQLSQLSESLQEWNALDRSKDKDMPLGGITLTKGSLSEDLRHQLIGNLEYIKLALYDPIDYLKELTQGRSLDIGVVRAIVRLNVASNIPLEQAIAVEELAGKVSLSPEALIRVISYAETLGLFYFTGPEKGHIAHTAFSACLAKGIYADLAAWDVTVPPAACLELSTMLQKFGSCDGPENAPFKIGLRTEDNFYQWHANNPKYGSLFHKGMESEEEDPRTSPHHIVSAYKWKQFRQKTIIDLGGSTGHVARSILEIEPGVRLIVQDLPDIIDESKKLTGAQPEFVVHDFFQEQNCVADAFLLRYILHNWTDKDCARILKALRPALQQGTKLLVVELLQDHEKLSSMTWFEDRIFRRRDLQMMSFIGAAERTMSDYIKLVRSEIPEFRFDGCHKPAGSFVAMLEWTYAASLEREHENK